MLQPIISVALAGATLGWTGWPSVLAHRLRRRWTAGPQQSDSPDAALSRLGPAVAILGRKNGPIQKLPQPLHHRAGAMRRGALRDLPALIAFSAHIQGMALPHAVRQCRLGPCPQAPQTLGKSPCARGVIRLPHPLVDLRTRGAQCCGGSSTDGEKRMATTQAHRDVGAPGLPHALRGLPAIGIDRLRRLSGRHGLRFAGKHAIRLFQGSLGG